MTTQCKQLDISVFVDDEKQDVDTDINLQLLNIRDKTIVNGEVVGAINIAEFTNGLKKAIIAYATQFGDVIEFELE